MEPNGTRQLEDLAQAVRRVGKELRGDAERAWASVKRTARHPAIGAAAVGVGFLAAGALWGASEAALAGVATYAAYRILRRKHSESRARSKPEQPPPREEQRL